ncbi:Globin-coupled histidine kinase [Vibrio palustris]|uniref:histidine kinase n=2 Tax=Vibrio palustris TaxID=1918946 RepID=A0A1R4B4Z9_9VIBR|nr:Globin-coupled histidine kinase [Vibrio palustris]
MVMQSLSLRLKTIVGIALIEIATLSVLVTITLCYLYETNYEGMEQRVSSTLDLYSTAITNPVLSSDLATLHDYTETLLKNKGVKYVAVLNNSGTILAEGGDYPSRFTPGMLEENSKAVTDSIYDVSHRIEEAGVTFGTIWIGFSMADIKSTIATAAKWAVIIVVLDILFVAIFSYILGTMLTKRLETLSAATAQISHGDFDIQLPLKGNDEVSKLTHAFNQMIMQLKSTTEQNFRYQSQLQEMNSSLEEKVKARTSQFLTVNQQLSTANEELIATQHQLIESEKMASLGIMASGFAHEINNPAGVISGNLSVCQSYIELYKERFKRQQALIDQHIDSQYTQSLNQWLKLNDFNFIDADILDSIKDSIKCVERIHSIVTALQYYSNERNNSRDGIEPIDIYPSLDRAISQTYKDESIELLLSPELRALPRILGIPNELDRLLTEVLQNAFQACQQKPQDTSSVAISSRVIEKHIILSIKDTGPGLSEANVKHLFDPFYTTLPVGEGMGLGLTYAYDIIKHLKGKIEINNWESGAEVILTLPTS